MIKTFNLAFGIVFLVFGFSAWISHAHGQPLLFGAFRVDTCHVIANLLPGAIALGTGLISEHTAKLFFRSLGLIYGIFAALSFVYGELPVFGLVANNTADAWLYTAIAASSLLLGFVVKDSSVPRLSEETT